MEKIKKQREILIKFGRNLKAERAKKGYSQEELGFKANISSNYISEMENAKYNPTLCIIEQLANALEVPIAKLVTFDF